MIKDGNLASRIRILAFVEAIAFLWPKSRWQVGGRGIGARVSYSSQIILLFRNVKPSC